jgi:DNA-binding NarL/FixJ family response regulator
VSIQPGTGGPAGQDPGRAVPMIRVIVADDEALVRDGLRAIAELEGDIEVIAEAATGDEAVALARQLRPDVVLMDVRMPGMDGIQATRLVLAEPDPPRVLVLTTFDRNHYVYEALKAGASGFLLKDVRRGQLARAIRDAVAGQTLLAPAITLRLIERFCQRPEPYDGAPPALAGLSPRELEVLRLLGRGMSNTQIANTLFVAETTVKTHVARILAKLNLRDRAQAVVVAYETGLIQPGTATGSNQPG